MVEKIKPSFSVNAWLVLTLGVLMMVLSGTKLYQISQKDSQQKSVKEKVVAEKTKNNIEQAIDDKETPRKSAIETAKLIGKSPMESKEFNLYSLYDSNEIFTAMLERVKSNHNLRKAINIAKDNDVKVFVGKDNSFGIGNNFIRINSKATDQEIIDFLLGK